MDLDDDKKTDNTASAQEGEYEEEYEEEEIDGAKIKVFKKKAKVQKRT